MQPVDYEAIASSYDRRYATNEYADVARYLDQFLRGATSIAEVGCGTGHWLALARASTTSRYIAGLDRAAAMLRAAQAACPDAGLVRGTADRLPWRSAAFDRVFCINALHHFPDTHAFYRECARVLRADGAFLSVGLDPHAGDDQWWIYDYFPSALAADQQRYPSTTAIRAGLNAAGFTAIETFVVQHLPAQLPFQDARTQGFLERGATSQLMVIDDAAWGLGLRRLIEEQPLLTADLRLYATIARRSEHPPGV